MKKSFLLLFLFGFFLSSNAQDCDNNFLDGDELNTDCGGEFCPTCLPLWYQVNCDEVQGQFELQVQLPTYLWNTDFFAQQMVYVLEGGFNVECYDLFECQGFIIVPDADVVNMQLKLYGPGPTTFAQGQISAQAACVKLDEIESDCPPDSNFVVTATSQWSDSTVYLVKLEMEGGTPPYKIADNDAQLFYHTQWNNDLYYLGVIPDSVALDISVFDLNGCRFDFPNIQRPEQDFGEVEDTTDINAIEKIVLANSLSIYPTIFDNQITLDFEQNKAATLTVYSIDGQQLAQWEVIGQKEVFTTTHLAKGTYIFTLETNDEVRTRIAIKE